MYKVYFMYCASHYTGFALIAANSAAEANEHIAEFKANDPENRYNSFGFCYVNEEDVIEDLSTFKEGIIYETVSYSGW